MKHIRPWILRSLPAVLLMGLITCILPANIKASSSPYLTVASGTRAALIDRVSLPDYARDLYRLLEENDASEADFLIADASYTLPKAESGVFPVSEISSVTVAGYLEPKEFSGVSDSLLPKDLQKEDVIFLDTNAGSGDKSLDYTELKPGDLVRTSNFNGIFVTKTGVAGSYDSNDLESVRENLIQCFHIYWMDHPEVFWLSGGMKLRMITPYLDSGKTVKGETYVFFVLRDNAGFSLRRSDYGSAAAIESAIGERDRAIQEVLAIVSPKDNAYERVLAMNNWLTSRNEYNTADPDSVPGAPHQSLSALLGKTGNSGPLSDGYSRAFKVLCDRLAIPCTLEAGYVRYNFEDRFTPHMWNAVRLPDGRWYGVDVAWNDPIISGKSGAVSGYENEEYLLVGADTEIRGIAFYLSHRSENLLPPYGITIPGGPILSSHAYITEPIPSSAAAAGTYGPLPASPSSPSSSAVPLTPVSPDPGSPAQVPPTTVPLTPVSPAPAAPTPIPLTPVSPTPEGSVSDTPASTPSEPILITPVPSLPASPVSSPVGSAENVPAPVSTLPLPSQTAAMSESAGTGAVLSDVPEGRYDSEALAWAVSATPAVVTETGQFFPDAPCTRADAVTFLWRAMGRPSPVGSDNPFLDVAAEGDASPAILWANENGITTGTGSNRFSPEDTITRAQAVTFLWRNAGSPETSAKVQFSDVPADAYFHAAVSWAVSRSPAITNGTGGGLFQPDLPCTRGQLVTFLYRAFA